MEHRILKLLWLWVTFCLSHNPLAAISPPPGYQTIDLEDGRCHSKSRVYITPMSPAFIRLGHSDKPSQQQIEKCKLDINAPEKFGITLTVNTMNMEYSSTYRSRNCIDYVQFERKWHSTALRFLATISASLFGDKSEEICKDHYQMDFKRPALGQLGSRTNMFNSRLNTIKMKYVRDSGRDDNEFTIVATAFNITDDGCVDSYIRCGGKSYSYCISDRLRCDGFINCGFVGSGVDEQGCDDDGLGNGSGVSTHTFVWVSLMLGLAVFICCLITCALRCRAPSTQSPLSELFREFLPANSGAELERRVSGDVSATAVSGTALPSYESVERDLQLRAGDMNSLPKYRDLFPESPDSPQQLPMNPLKRWQRVRQTSN